MEVLFSIGDKIQISHWPLLYSEYLSILCVFWTVLVFIKMSLSLSWLFPDLVSALAPVKKSCHETELLNYIYSSPAVGLSVFSSISKAIPSLCMQSHHHIAQIQPPPGAKLALGWACWFNVETVRFPCWTCSSGGNAAFIFQIPQRWAFSSSTCTHALLRARLELSARTAIQEETLN